MPAAKKTDQKKSETAPKPEKEYKQTGLSDKDDDWRTTIDWEVIYRSITILVLVLVPFFVYDMIKFRDWCDRTGR